MNNEFGTILAGGIGARFGSSIPKQYMKLNGREILSYSIESFRSSRLENRFIVVCNDAEFKSKNIERKYNVICIQGGITRNESIYNGLLYIKKNYPEIEKVIIHDGVRPFFQSQQINIYLDLLEEYEAVITSVKITDSLGYKNNTAVNREEYYLIQAPEAFRYPLLLKYFNKESIATTPLHQLPETTKIYKYFDFKYNLKITYPQDLFIAEQYIRVVFNNSQLSYSADMLEKNKKVLVLGGTGGLGKEVVKQLTQNNIEFVAPTRKELDMRQLSVENINKVLGTFIPDIIINCAAATTTDNDGLLEQFDEIFNVNLKSNFALVEYAIHLNKVVHLVLISSSSSSQGRENIALYSASKAGVNSLVESLSKKCIKKNVYLNAVVPEKINTPMIEKLHGSISTHDLLNIEEVMNTIWYLASQPVYGKLVHVRKGL